MNSRSVCLALVCLRAAPFANAQNYAVSEDQVSVGRDVEYSPYFHQSYPDRVFWGDTHLHTSYSTDAGMVGDTVAPDEALRFAKGEKITSSSGLDLRLIPSSTSWLLRTMRKILISRP